MNIELHEGFLDEINKCCKERLAKGWTQKEVDDSKAKLIQIKKTKLAVEQYRANGGQQ